jgi:hypothetical protein
MNAFAVAGDGVPLGLIDQIYWIREKLEVMPKNERTARNQQRPFEEKECANFIRAAESAIERLSKRGARVCVVIDREADNTDILFALNRLDCDFIVRAQYDRKKISATALSLRETLGKQPVLGCRIVDIGRTGQRAARNAVVELRSHRVFFDVRSGGSTREAGRLELNAVCVKEIDSTEKDALDWVLLTNLEASSFDTRREGDRRLSQAMANRRVSSDVEAGRLQHRGRATPLARGASKVGNDSRRRGDANRAFEVSRAHDS